jgi:putative tricarboxylic transport membrane protein
VISRVEARLPGIVVAVLGVLFCVGAVSYGVVDDGRMGPGLMPMVTGLGLVVLGTAIAVTARPDGPAVTADGAVAPTEGEPVEGQLTADDLVRDLEVHHPSRPWLILAAIVGALIAAPLTGLIPALGVMALVLLRFVERESWLLSGIVSVCLVVGSWLVFEELLEVNLPWGVLEGLM